MSDIFDPKWRTEPWRHDGRKWSGSAQTWAEIAFVRLADGEAPDDAFTRLPYEEVMGWISKLHRRAPLAASTLTYLTRRFGPSSSGFDGYKDLGVWHLTTPSPDLMVSIRPKGASVGIGICSPARADHDEPTGEVLAAVRATLVDLLRPTNVRDEYINAAGACEPIHGDDDDDGPSQNAEYFKWAGCGVTPDYWLKFEKDDEGGRR